MLFNCPFFVVINITPCAPRAPYIAEEAASFNTSTEAISCGFKFDKLKLAPVSVGDIGFPIASITNPSTTINGFAPLPPKLPWVVCTPRTINLGISPGFELVLCTCNPATRPCKALIGLLTIFSSALRLVTRPTEPVNSLRLRVP
ncbi:hypothetical protein D3C73_878550 [compost metagenome]